MLVDVNQQDPCIRPMFSWVDKAIEDSSRPDAMAKGSRGAVVSFIDSVVRHLRINLDVIQNPEIEGDKFVGLLTMMAKLAQDIEATRDPFAEAVWRISEGKPC